MPKPTDMSEKAIARRERYNARIAADPEFAERRREYSRAHNERHLEQRRVDAKEAARRRKADPEYAAKIAAYQKDYREKNRERLREHDRQKHAENREHRNEQSRQYYEKHREQISAQGETKRQKARITSPYRALLTGIKIRARKAGIPFDLDRAFLESIWTGRCEVSGIPFVLGLRGFGPKPFGPSIDRIIPERGYVKGNVRFVLWAVNALKHIGSDEEMYRVAVAIAKNYRPKSTPSNQL